MFIVNDIYNYEQNIIKNYESNIIINITTTMDMLKSNLFNDYIMKLYNQILHPKYIFIHIYCDNGHCCLINDQFPNLFINCSKISNLIKFKKKINNTDKIIFMNDTFNNITTNFILMYELCYQLYNCDKIIPCNNSKYIFWDNYYNKENIDFSYSIKFNKIDNEILYICSININVLINTNINIPNEFMSTPNLYINIDPIIYPRYLLYCSNDIDIIQTNYINKHIYCNYYNDNIIIITITYFDKIPINDYIIINNNKIFIENQTLYSKKITFCIYTNKINKIEHKNYNYNIFQTDKINNIELNKFYSILTITNNLPDVQYHFYNDIDIINLMKTSKTTIINFYNLINDNIMKIKLFKLWYLYHNEGLYFDCKNILFSTDTIKLDDKIYFMNFEYYDKTKLLFILIKLCTIIFNNEYDYNLLFDTTNCSIINNNWENNVIIYNNKLISKLAYFNYYRNNNSYSLKIWRKKCLYYEYNINYNKINKINLILWINLDRSTERKSNMENILKNINVPNIRISAIDGDTFNFTYNFLDNMNKYEKGCALSHLKAIQYLQYIEGDYFMICEDDITFRNINLFNNDLQDIIDNAPIFDILMISQLNCFHKIVDLYTCYDSSHHNKLVGSAACYIISKAGVNHFKNIINNIQMGTTIIGIADIWMYTVSNTYFYKYNFIDTKNLNDSSIDMIDNDLFHKNSSEYAFNSILKDFI
uniref:Glycosyl transferase family 25 domain-containing protein n=1 Tax=viral metagenome TaxID=1070528 RepID=A0A6C0H7D7_9ZZZZ